MPNQPGEGEGIFREDLGFAQGTLHLVTTNLDFAFNIVDGDGDLLGLQHIPVLVSDSFIV